MPSPTTPPDSAPSQLRLHVSNTAVARIAAYYACQVPGVLRLHPDRARGMASVATRQRSAHDGEHQIPTDGVTAVVSNGRAEISLALVTRWGCNCRHIAEAVRDDVAEQVRSYTALAATVDVTITDVDYYDA